MTNVVELPRATLEDVPTVLRAIADRIEAHAYGTPVNAVVVLECQDEGLRIEVFGAGAFNEVQRSLGLLALGSAQLAADHIDHPRRGMDEGPE